MKMNLGRILLLAWVCALPGGVEAEPVGTARNIIAHLQMEKIPAEGCWFVLTYHSSDVLAPAAVPSRYAGSRLAGSGIYGLETTDDFSALHRLKTDEMWHFYGGDPLEMLLLYPDGRAETVILGPDVLHGQRPQFVVPRGVWQGSKPVGKATDAYSFFGDTLAPGFDPADFEIGYRDELQKAYPKAAAKIAGLTRSEFAARPASAPGLSRTGAESERAVTPHSFNQEEVKTIAVAPGIDLRELVGRVAKARSDAYSLAAFRIEKGKGMPVSYNKVSAEVLYVTGGSGQATLGEQVIPVRKGSVVVVDPRVLHSIGAGAAEGIEFVAISVPPYAPDDYVLAPPK